VRKERRRACSSIGQAKEREKEKEREREIQREKKQDIKL
jgi:hypothetical protein